MSDPASGPAGPRNNWLDLRGGFICGADCDDVFTYDMPRMARIRNSRLGLLYYFLVLAIAFYIGVYQMWYGLQYLSFADPDCTVRMTFQQPVSPSGCSPTNPTCEDTIKPISSLSYCCNSSCTYNSDGSCNCPWQPSSASFSCKYFDGLQAATISDSSILLSSFIRSFDQSLNATCSGAGGCGKLWITGKSSSSYVAGVEDYTVMLEHSLMQSTLDIFKPSSDIRGFLHVNGNGPLQRQLCSSQGQQGQAFTAPYQGASTSAAPCYIVPPTTSTGNDLLSVRSLLQAMEVSLDQVQGAGTKSLRYEGFTVTLSIHYQNYWPWQGVLRGANDVIAVYELHPVLENSFKFTSLIWAQYGETRIQEDKRGVLLSIRPGGQLARFDFQALLLTLTTSLTLLAIASTIVKYLAIYVLHFKEYYQELFVHVSPDFSYVRDWETKDDEFIDNALKALSLPLHGDRAQKVLRLIEHPKHHEFLVPNDDGDVGEGDSPPLPGEGVELRGSARTPLVGEPH